MNSPNKISQGCLLARSTLSQRIFLGFILISFTLFPRPQAQAQTKDPETKYNFVIFLTDDQRWDTVGDSGVNAEIKQRYGRPIMPEVEKRLVEKGVLFTNAAVTTPLCCPYRASLLSGGFYAQNTGVKQNELPNGGARKFKDDDSLAVQLQEAGYQTALIGKYMNEYSKMQIDLQASTYYVPPGWSKFFVTSNEGLIAPAEKKMPRATKKSAKKPAPLKWFNPCAVRGNSGSSSSEGKVECFSDYYVTDLQRDEALKFVEEVGDRPFFLYFSTHAPHAPATPSPGDKELFSDYKYRARAYGEEDISDKPGWLSEEIKQYDEKKEDGFHLQQLRSLQAVDRAIGAIVDKIEKLGKLQNTVFIFTADNGYLWGEHGLKAKAMAYEESIRVPLVVVIPGEDFRQAQTDEHLVAPNLDIGATIFELIDRERKTDGQSLVFLLKGLLPFGRSEVLLENYSLRVDKHNWAGLRTPEYKYVEYANEKQEKELYDLKSDPYEKQSKHNEADYQEIMQMFSERLKPQKGLTILNFPVPKLTVKEPYVFQMRAWGGLEPYLWSITAGPKGGREELPAGLSLDSSTGLISGTPTSPEKRVVWIKVEDSRIVHPAGQVQSFTASFVFAPSVLTHGPLAGAVTLDSAKVWLRTDSQAKVQVEYAPDPDFDNEPLLSESFTTSAANDYTATITLNNLSPDTTYYYRILIDGRVVDFPAPGQTYARFKTFAEDAKAVKVGILTDLTSAGKGNVPAPAMAALSHDEPDFVLVLGDWDHRNVFTLEEMRAMHRQTRQGTVSGNTFRDYILYRFPVAHVWDDHDYAGNNSDKTFENKQQAIQAYDEYWPGYERPNPQAGVWHNFKYGELVEVFMLDLRSQRDLNSYKDPRYVPGKEPNPSRDLIRNDSCRSMLDGNSCPEGKSQGQKDWLKEGLRNSTAKWKIIASTVPWNPTTFKDDAWWDFKAEQEELLRFIKENNISGVMLVSGDIHTGGAIDDERNTGLPEMNVPTVNLDNKTHETCNLTNPHQRIGCGDWSEGYSPDGIGYGLITLSGESALLEAKDEKAQTRFKLELLGEPDPGDNQNPTVSITAPGNGEIVQGGILIHAEAIDNVGIDRVEFLIAGKTTIDNSLPYEMDWDSRKVEDGPYILIAKAYDTSGNSAEQSIEIRVENELPLKADFTASPREGNVPLEVKFTDLSIGKIDSWEWTFWDVPAPVGSAAQNPVHTFTQAGTYKVSLTVSKQSGEHHNITKDNFILVKDAPGHHDHPPKARAGKNQIVRSQDLVELNGAKSLDPDSDPLTYQWRQIAGPEVALSGNDQAIATFSAPEVKKETELKFELSVRAKNKTDKDQTTVLVRPILPQEIPFQAIIIGKNKCQIEVRLSAASPSRLFARLSYKIKDSAGKIVKRGGLSMGLRDRQGQVHYATMDDFYLPIAPYTAQLEAEGKVIANANFGDYNTPADQLSLGIPLFQPILGEKNLFRFKLKAFSTQQPKACLRYKLINKDKAKIVQKGHFSFIPKIKKEKAFYTISHRNYSLELPKGNYHLLIESSYGGRLEKELRAE